MPDMLVNLLNLPPLSVYVAMFEKHLVGFAAFECTRKAFFGPLG